MSDYISKGKLMSHIESQYKSFGEDYDALQILGDIEDFPTEERPHGEWLEVYLTPEEKCFFGELWECSVCKVKDKKSNFCPNCGADMRKRR